MQDSDAAGRLRDLLARSGAKAPVQPTLQHTKTITPVPSPPVTAKACMIPPKPLDLDYPRVRVPGSSQSSVSAATPPSSPKSIFGSGLFSFSRSSSRTTVPHSLSNSQSGGFFNSLFRRSTADRREDGAKDRQSVAVDSTELSSSGSSYCVVGSSMNMLPGLTSIFHSGSPSRIAGGNALLRARSEDSISAKRNDFEHRRYKASKASKTAPSSPKTLSLRPTSRRVRTISWADQIPKQAAKSPLPSSDLEVGEAQTKHSSEIAPLFAQEDFDSSPSSSTLSLNSPFSSSPHLPAQPPTHRPDTANTMPTSLRDLSPFKGKPLWEPDDDEWAELDATQISSTFKATFRDPSQRSPQKPTNTSTLSRFSATLTSLIPTSPTKRASDALLREEEALRDKLEELQNTYYSNPAGDICDKVMTSVFLPGSQHFHYDQARDLVRAPHVIDLEAYFTTQDPLVGVAYPRLSDAIATIFSHTNKECVEAFLDPRVEEFVYRREVERNKAGSIFVIRRKGNAVIAGSYRNLGFSLSWTLYVKAMIGATGLWYDTYASPVSGSTPIVDGVPAWDTFVPIGTEDPCLQLSSESSPQPATSPRKIILTSPRPRKKDVVEEDEISPTNEKYVLYQSRTLARYLLRDVWVRLEGRYECKATWEVDGVGREVRLRRALVGFGDEDDDE